MFTDQYKCDVVLIESIDNFDNNLVRVEEKHPSDSKSRTELKHARQSSWSFRIQHKIGLMFA